MKLKELREIIEKIPSENDELDVVVNYYTTGDEMENDRYELVFIAEIRDSYHSLGIQKAFVIKI